MELGIIDLDDKIRSQSNTIVFGPPGSGKSFSLEYLMRQDLKKRQPFCCIDRHGSSFERMVRWCVYNGYYDRNLIILNPSDGAYIKPFNPFRRIEGLDVGVQTSSMVEAVLSIWGDRNANSYPVMFKILKIVFTVVVEKGLPLHEAFHLLANRKRLTAMVETLSDPYIKTVWEDLRRLSQSEWSRQVTPTLNRLFRIVQSRAIQRFMYASEGKCLELNFRDTILVNLATSGNLDADAANMIAVLLINHFYHAAKRRRGKAGKDPSPYFLYFDEWVLPTPDFSRILAECRKFGFLMCLANQDLSQVKTAFGSGFADTLLTLCQMQLCFGGINNDDARRLAREWGIEASALFFLKDRQCVARLPRQPAQAVEIPELRDPFVREEKITEFERRIAEKTGALPVEEIDRMLACSSDDRGRYVSEDDTEDDTEDGWAVRK